VAPGATRLSLVSLDLDDPMRRQPRPSLGDELFDAIDGLDALGDVGVSNQEELGLALHAAPLVQLGRAFRRAPTEWISR
jgi:hypothetical protein